MCVKWDEVEFTIEGIEINRKIYNNGRIKTFEGEVDTIMSQNIEKNIQFSIFILSLRSKIDESQCV